MNIYKAAKALLTLTESDTYVCRLMNHTSIPSGARVFVPDQFVMWDSSRFHRTLTHVFFIKMVPNSAVFLNYVR